MIATPTSTNCDLATKQAIGGRVPSTSGSKKGETSNLCVSGGRAMIGARLKGKVGRKLAIEGDPKLIGPICNLLEQGCSVRTVCECVGLSQSAFFEYVRRGDPKAVDHDPRFLEFVERVTRARGKGKANLVQSVKKAAAKDWRAALALLERLSPSEYGRTEPHSAEISVKVDSDVIAELLRRELASRKPNEEKIAHLRSTLEEVRAANQEALRLFTNWDADALTEVYFKPFS